jgi:hypothetical protein
MAATSSNCVALVLKELGWSYTRLIAELRRHASVALPKTREHGRTGQPVGEQPPTA